MKKILLFLVLGFCAFIVNAQDPQTLESVDQSAGYGIDASYFYYHGTATDNLESGDSIWNYTVRIKSQAKLKPHVYFELDSTGGTFAATSISLYSKVASYSPWVLRETATWTAGADTSDFLESDSSHISEFWKFEVKAANDAFEADIKQYFLKWVEEK